MRVLMVTGEYPPALGGIGDYTALLCRHLATVGARVAVLTASAGVEASAGAARVPAEALIPSSQIVPGGELRVLRSVGSWGFSCWPRVALAAAGSRAQLVHIQYQAAAYAMQPSVNLLPGYLRARLRGVKTVTTFHDLRVPYLFPKAGGLRRGALRLMDAWSHGSVVTNRADLATLGGENRGQSRGIQKRWLIPLATNVENAPPPQYDRVEWRRQVGAGPNTPLLCWFGFMNDSKGVESLLESLGLLVRRGLGARLQIVGGAVGDTDSTNLAYSQRMAQLIRSSGLEDRVALTGFVAPDRVSAALLASDLCVLPFRDGASLRRGSLLVALAHHLPVVTTCPQPVESLLENGVNVVMVERDDPKALADAVERLWNDPAARSRLALGAGRLAQRFRWPEIAARHLEMYGVLAG